MKKNYKNYLDNARLTGENVIKLYSWAEQKHPGYEVIHRYVTWLEAELQKARVDTKTGKV